MKKIVSLIVSVILTIGLMGCDASADSEQAISSAADTVTEHVEETVSDEAYSETATSSKVDADVANNSDKENNSDNVSHLSDTENTSNISSTRDTTVAGEIILTDESLTITEAGTYTVSGSLENGQIIIDAGDADDVELILKNVQINSNQSAAINVINADKVTITSQGDNSLSIGADISDNVDGIDGVIYSKSDLIFDGTGTLAIVSENTHGIVGKDDITFVNGYYNIDVSQDGIQANDSVSVENTSLSIVAD